MILYKQRFLDPDTMGMDLETPNLRADMEKTRMALDTAYAGFNNATDFDMIDSYIFEINALKQRYNHLSELLEKEAPVQTEPSGKHSSVLSRITHIFR